MLTARHETGTDGGRSAEQVQQQEGVAAEIADQGEILFAGNLGQRPVVVDAGDGLHAPAVAVRQAHAVHAFGAAHVRRAIPADGNVLVGRQVTGHAGDPQHLVGQRAVSELVDLQQLFQAGLGCGMYAGDQLQLRFAVVGGDVRMRQRRAQRLRMRRHGQPAFRRGAQAFLFDAAAYALQPIRRKGGKARLQVAHVNESLWCHVVGVGRKVARLSNSCFDAGQRQIW